MILDTSFLIDLKDGDSGAFATAVELFDGDVVQRVAIPSVMELYYGAHFTRSEEELRKVRNLLLMYPLVDIDENLSRRAGELLADADRRDGGDSGVDNEDAIIGAVAEQFGEPVLTDNVDHFEKLDIDVETY